MNPQTQTQDQMTNPPAGQTQMTAPPVRRA
jgi:hypothetical protein